MPKLTSLPRLTGATKTTHALSIYTSLLIETKEEMRITIRVLSRSQMYSVTNLAVASALRLQASIMLNKKYNITILI